MVRKNITDQKLLEKFYREDHKHGRKELKLINDSPAYIRYKKQVEEEKANRPFYYSEQERGQIMKLIQIGIKDELPNMDIWEQHYNKRIDKHIGNPPSVENITTTFFRYRTRHFAKLVRWKGEVMPEHLRDEDWQPRPVTWDEMVDTFNQMRKRDITRYIPSELLNQFALLWEMAITKNNHYGYTRFLPHGMADLIRLQIDIRAGRDVVQDTADVIKLMNETYIEIENETQPYVRRADERV